MLSHAGHFLLIQPDDRFLQEGGLKERVNDRISLGIFARSSRASGHRNRYGPFMVVKAILGTIRSEGMRFLEAWKVRAIPRYGSVHFGIVYGIEVGLHFAPTHVRLRQTDG